jgi:hypothetical protein
MIDEILEDMLSDLNSYVRDLNTRQYLVLLQNLKEEINSRIFAAQEDLESEEADGEYDDERDSDNDE